MRKYFLISVSMVMCLCSLAQPKTVDSLKSLLAKTRTDTGRLRLYSRLGNYYSYLHTDSSVYFARLALETAKKIKIPLILGEQYSAAGYSYYVAGDYVKALRSFLLAMSILEEISSGSERISKGYARLLSNMRDATTSVDTLRTRLIGRVHYLIAFIYYRTDQKDKTIQELLISKKICEDSKDSAYLYFTLNNLSNAYSLNRKYVKGVEAGKQAYELSSKLKLTGSLAMTKTYIGYNYLKLGKIAEAKKYFYQATEVVKVSGNLRAQVLPYQYLAEAFLISKQTDSALYYAHQALDITQKQKFKGMVMPVDTLLAAIHEARNGMDSAYYYLKASNIIRDELFNGQKSQELQSIVEGEQKRKTDLLAAKKDYAANLKLFGLGAGLLLLFITLLLVYRSNRLKQKGFELLQKQKNETDLQKAETEKALEHLRATQHQLVQSEKMASLGELTAGIAHEIQNPLNFVNNFSEVSTELVDEMEEALQKDDKEEAIAIAGDIKENLVKINHHGQRADAIVKGMLQHSRSSKGEKEPTDINALADEYLRLSYHGLRAKDKSFNADFKTDFDESIGKVKVAPQDIGRVLLNLYNNAFYSVNEKKKQLNGAFEPTLEVRTHKRDGKVEIHVKDNGNGIPQKVVDKIFQPFFTTKPTGHGTGLGLSLSYDIVKAHGGELKVETKEGEGAEFIIQIPV